MVQISKALVHVKATQCPHIALHASLACLHRQAELSLQPDWQSQYINLSSRSGEAEPLVGGRVLSLVIYESSWRAIICLRWKYLAISPSRGLNYFTLYIIIINLSPASAMLTYHFAYC